MKSVTYSLSFFLLACFTISQAQDIREFSLQNTDGKMVSLGSYSTSKALVIIFSGNHCVYSKKYEDRIIKFAADYRSKGVQLVLINSNSPELSEDDRLEMMKARALEKGFTFAYLQDPDQAVAKNFGATKNPEAFLLAPADGKWKILYSGLIDDNPLMAEAVKVNYLAKAIDAFLSSGNSGIGPTLPTGCAIKGIE